ncbi:hypothetical protein H310_04091 [Aphanomyces invadans]|uniref:BHLH domain-containing protein n=1 Tax=Aphanomyces invadans TaxID=157072 RepID=A0A024UF67_9STRA|nr:hypothetical protein H310_04091 [Aphanomyces invadans]ETW05051.1 hypothetical protein H310_04091 [Aphanomyces invadans]|eukprot:XP_008866489.1 hypothetical protein H310_04091 [Aphanomyces invadans]
MDFDDMSSLQIEDLGRFLSEHMPAEPGAEDWKGFSLGYADEEGSSPHAGSSTTTSQPAATHTQFKSALLSNSLPNSPFPSVLPLLTRQALDSAMSEFSDFSLEEKAIEPPAVVHQTIQLPSETPSPQLTQTRTQSQQHNPTVQLPTLAATTSSTTPSSMKRPFGVMQSCDSSSCSTIGGGHDGGAFDDEDDRGFRKKSREKMRRHEVNVKFDELTILLGMNDKVRKSAVLQEAITTIKLLTRERDELRVDRDRMKQEVSKLASCLQFSHMGSMVAANAMAMTQMPSPAGPTGHFPMAPPGYGMSFHPYMAPTGAAPQHIIPPASLCPPIAPKIEAKPKSG